MRGLCFASKTTPCSFFLNFMQLVRFHIVKICLFESRSTFGALWEEYIPFEIGHISDMKTNVSNGLLALSS